MLLLENCNGVLSSNGSADLLCVETLLQPCRKMSSLFPTKKRLTASAGRWCLRCRSMWGSQVPTADSVQLSLVRRSKDQLLRSATAKTGHFVQIMCADDNGLIDDESLNGELDFRSKGELTLHPFWWTSGLWRVADSGLWSGSRAQQGAYGFIFISWDARKGRYEILHRLFV